MKGLDWSTGESFLDSAERLLKTMKQVTSEHAIMNALLEDLMDWFDWSAIEEAEEAGHDTIDVPLSIVKSYRKRYDKL